ncbi:CoA transferase [Pseudohaliea sp.]|uniref:CaiB/BaiF CoA-transferase family protein n=1 Tax=Pseudohaliea sp. TaxID=2740289 RepID=UPI0032EC740B
MLAPYRVLDLTDGPAQLAGYMLAQMGADVLLLEPPEGHRSRALRPFANDSPGPDASLTHLAYNRGKRSIVIEEEGALRALAGRADILIESGAMAVDLQALRTLNPTLITVSISAFGQTGPKAGWAATDLTVCAAAGTLGMTGDADRAPVRVCAPQAFAFAAADAACAALIALAERFRSGLGQHADISAQQSYLSATQFQTLAPLVGKPAATRLGGGIQLGRVTVQTVHRCADGHVIGSFLFGPIFGPYAKRLFQWIHEEGQCSAWWAENDWITFGRKVDQDASALEAMKEGTVILQRFLAGKSKDELFRAAMERRLLLAPVMTARDLLEFEHLRKRNWWQDVEGSRAPGAFARAPASPFRILGRAPATGEHTSELREHLESTPGKLPTKKRESQHGPALAGLRVLDFTWAVAGPGSTRILADHGATVIRIESQHKLDVLRGAGPYLGKDGEPENSVSWHTANAGKLGLTLNLRHPKAREVVLDLARWADVVVESFSSGTMARMGIGYEDLRAVKPDLIMLSSCLLGSTGPLHAYSGFGGAGAAIAGFYPLTGWPDRLPAGPYGAYSDYTSPRFMAAAILGALEWRRRTGEGQHIDFSQMEGAVQMIAPQLLEEEVNGKSMERCGNKDRNMVPHGVYPVPGRDAWIAIACEDNQQWQALATLMDRRDLADLCLDERKSRSDELDQVVAAWTANCDGAALEAQLQAAGIPAHRVSYAADIVTDPQLAHRNHLVRVPHAEHGETWVEGTPIHLSRTPGGPRWAGPTMGQHLFEVLTDVLGYDDGTIADHIASGVFE